jgi:cupredoxin-like protein
MQPSIIRASERKPFVKRCVALVAALAVVLGVAAPVLAADPSEIPLVIEKNRFEPDVIKVKAGAPFVLVITNKDKGPEELDMLSPRIEKVIPAGKTVRLKMPALKPGKYPFVGEYHSETAKATIVAE